jgi:signal transduction histidine kinase
MAAAALSPPPADPLPGAGLGLSGLRERVGLLGGEF